MDLGGQVTYSGIVDSGPFRVWLNDENGTRLKELEMNATGAYSFPVLHGEKYDVKAFRDANGDGWIDLNLAIARSNDTYFYDLAHKMGIDRLHDYMSRFGIGQRVALDMFEETAGLMPSRDWKRARFRQPWYPGETLILGIGQGYMQTTPLQLARSKRGGEAEKVSQSFWVILPTS